MTTIVGVSGSLRRGSYNTGLLRAAAAAMPEGARLELASIRDIPLYDGDVETDQGIPAAVAAFKDAIAAADGLLLATPEYNNAMPGVLKNAIDWASRAEKNEPALAAYKGKVAGLLAASPGQLGGLRGLVTLRSILGNLQVLVIPEQLAIARANEAFSPDGKLVDTKQQSAVEAIAARVVHVAGALAAPR